MKNGRFYQCKANISIKQPMLKFSRYTNIFMSNLFQALTCEIKKYRNSHFNILNKEKRINIDIIQSSVILTSFPLADRHFSPPSCSGDHNVVQSLLHCSMCLTEINKKTTSSFVHFIYLLKIHTATTRKSCGVETDVFVCDIVVGRSNSCRVITFTFGLIPLGKVWIHVFFFSPTRV